jgi:hypothetical protein
MKFLGFAFVVASSFLALGSEVPSGCCAGCTDRATTHKLSTFALKWSTPAAETEVSF